MAGGEQLDWFGFAELTDDPVPASDLISPRPQANKPTEAASDNTDAKTEVANDESARLENEVVVPILYPKSGVKKYKVLARQKVEDDIVVVAETPKAGVDESDRASSSSRDSPSSTEQRKENINVKKTAVKSKTEPPVNVVKKKQVNTGGAKVNSGGKLTSGGKVVSSGKVTKLFQEKSIKNKKTSVKQSPKTGSGKHVVIGAKIETKTAHTNAGTTVTVVPKPSYSGEVHVKASSKTIPITAGDVKQKVTVSVVGKTDVKGVAEAMIHNTTTTDSEGTQYKKETIPKIEKMHHLVSPMKCLVKLNRDPSIESIVHSEDSVKDHKSVEAVDREHQSSVSDRQDTGDNEMMDGELQQRSSLTPEVKPMEMVYNAQNIEVRKSGRLKSAKCASRYRGDYGIRAETYTKLVSQKSYTPNDSELDSETAWDGDDTSDLDNTDFSDRNDKQPCTCDSSSRHDHAKTASGICDIDDNDRLSIKDHESLHSLSDKSHCDPCKVSQSKGSAFERRERGSSSTATSSSHGEASNKPCADCGVNKITIQVPSEGSRTPCKCYKCISSCDIDSSSTDATAKPGSSKQFDGGTGNAKSAIPKLANFHKVVNIYSKESTGYVHSVGKSVNKKQNCLDRKKDAAHKDGIAQVDSSTAEGSPRKDGIDPLKILENLRQKLFASAGADMKEADKTPKAFESTLISSKRKVCSNSEERAKVAHSSLAACDVTARTCCHHVQDNDCCSVKSGRSTPRCSTPRSEASSEILDEVSVETIQKVRQKTTKGSKKSGKGKRQRFEDKKFALRSLSKNDTNTTEVIDGETSVRRGSAKHKPHNIDSDSDTGDRTLESQATVNDADLKPCSNSDDEDKKTQDTKKTKSKPRSIKCQACNHTFKNREVLRQHYPCRVRQTRTWSQNKLRPNRAVKRTEPNPKKFVCQLPKSTKAVKTRPQLIIYRKTKFRKVKGKRRRRLYQAIQELIHRRQPMKLPHLSIIYDDMSFKEQCLYRIGLMCIGSPAEGLDKYSADELNLFETHKTIEKDNAIETKSFKPLNDADVGLVETEENQDSDSPSTQDSSQKTEEAKSTSEAVSAISSSAVTPTIPVRSEPDISTENSSAGKEGSVGENVVENILNEGHKTQTDNKSTELKQVAESVTCTENDKEITDETNVQIDTTADASEVLNDVTTTTAHTVEDTTSERSTHELFEAAENVVTPSRTETRDLAKEKQAHSCKGLQQSDTPISSVTEVDVQSQGTQALAADASILAETVVQSPANVSELAMSPAAVYNVDVSETGLSGVGNGDELQVAEVEIGHESLDTPLEQDVADERQMQTFADTPTNASLDDEDTEVDQLADIETEILETESLLEQLNEAESNEPIPAETVAKISLELQKVEEAFMNSPSELSTVASTPTLVNDNYYGNQTDMQLGQSSLKDAAKVGAFHVDNVQIGGSMAGGKMSYGHGRATSIHSSDSTKDPFDDIWERFRHAHFSSSPSPVLQSQPPYLDDMSLDKLIETNEQIVADMVDTDPQVSQPHQIGEFATSQTLLADSEEGNTAYAINSNVNNSNAETDCSDMGLKQPTRSITTQVEACPGVTEASTGADNHAGERNSNVENSYRALSLADIEAKIAISMKQIEEKLAKSKDNSVKGQFQKENSNKDRVPKDNPNSFRIPKVNSSKGHVQKDNSSKGHVQKDISNKGRVQKDTSSKGHIPKGYSSKGPISKDISDKDQLPKDNASKGRVQLNKSSKVSAPKDLSGKGQISKDNSSKGHALKENSSKGQITKDSSSKASVVKDTKGKVGLSKDNSSKHRLLKEDSSKCQFLKHNSGTGQLPKDSSGKKPSAHASSAKTMKTDVKEPQTDIKTMSTDDKLTRTEEKRPKTDTKTTNTDVKKSQTDRKRKHSTDVKMSRTTEANTYLKTMSTDDKLTRTDAKIPKTDIKTPINDAKTDAKTHTTDAKTSITNVTTHQTDVQPSKTILKPSKPEDIFPTKKSKHISIDEYLKKKGLAPLKKKQKDTNSESGAQSMTLDTGSDKDIPKVDSGAQKIDNEKPKCDAEEPKVDAEIANVDADKLKNDIDIPSYTPTAKTSLVAPEKPDVESELGSSSNLIEKASDLLKDILDEVDEGKLKDVTNDTEDVVDSPRDNFAPRYSVYCPDSDDQGEDIEYDPECNYLLSDEDGEEESEDEAYEPKSSKVDLREWRRLHWSKASQSEIEVEESQRYIIEPNLLLDVLHAVDVINDIVEDQKGFCDSKGIDIEPFETETTVQPIPVIISSAGHVNVCLMEDVAFEESGLIEGNTDWPPEVTADGNVTASAAAASRDSSLKQIPIHSDETADVEIPSERHTANQPSITDVGRDIHDQVKSTFPESQTDTPSGDLKAIAITKIASLEDVSSDEEEDVKCDVKQPNVIDRGHADGSKMVDKFERSGVQGKDETNNRIEGDDNSDTQSSFCEDDFLVLDELSEQDIDETSDSPGVPCKEEVPSVHPCSKHTETQVLPPKEEVPSIRPCPPQTETQVLPPKEEVPNIRPCFPCTETQVMPVQDKAPYIIPNTNQSAKPQVPVVSLLDATSAPIFSSLQSISKVLLSQDEAPCISPNTQQSAKTPVVSSDDSTSDNQLVPHQDEAEPLGLVPDLPKEPDQVGKAIAESPELSYKDESPSLVPDSRQNSKQSSNYVSPKMPELCSQETDSMSKSSQSSIPVLSTQENTPYLKPLAESKMLELSSRELTPCLIPETPQSATQDLPTEEETPFLLPDSLKIQYEQGELSDSPEHVLSPKDGASSLIESQDESIDDTCLDLADETGDAPRARKSAIKEGSDYTIKYEMNGLVIKENLLTGDKNVVDNSSPFRSSAESDVTNEPLSQSSQHLDSTLDSSTPMLSPEETISTDSEVEESNTIGGLNDTEATIISVNSSPIHAIMETEQLPRISALKKCFHDATIEGKATDDYVFSPSTPGTPLQDEINEDEVEADMLGASSPPPILISSDEVSISEQEGIVQTGDLGNSSVAESMSTENETIELMRTDAQELVDFTTGKQSAEIGPLHGGSAEVGHTDHGHLKVAQGTKSRQKVVPSPPVLEKVDMPEVQCVELFEDTSSQQSVLSASSGPPTLEPEAIVEGGSKDTSHDSKCESDKHENLASKNKPERHFLDVIGAVCEKASSELPSPHLTVIDKGASNYEDTKLFKTSTPVKSKKVTDVNENIGRHFSDIIGDPVKPASKLESMFDKSENGEITLAQIKHMLKPIKKRSKKKGKKKYAVPKESLIKIRSGIAKLLSKVKQPEKKDPAWLKRDALTSYSKKNRSTNQELDDYFTSSDESDESTDEMYNTDNQESEHSNSAEKTNKKSVADNIMEMLRSFEDKGSIADNMTNLLDFLAENLGFLRKAGKSDKISISDSDSDSDFDYTTETNPRFTSNVSATEDESHKAMIANFLEDEDGPPCLEEIPTADDTDFTGTENDTSLVTDEAEIGSELHDHVEMDDNNTDPDLTISYEMESSEDSEDEVKTDELNLTEILQKQNNSDFGIENQMGSFDEELFDKYENSSKTSASNYEPEQAVNCMSVQADVVEQPQEKVNANVTKSKARTIFKSITELNSIETDEESDGGNTFDDLTMSRNLSQLKVQGKDSAWEIHSNYESDTVISDIENNEDDDDEKPVEPAKTITSVVKDKPIAYQQDSISEYSEPNKAAPHTECNDETLPIVPDKDDRDITETYDKASVSDGIALTEIGNATDEANGEIVQVNNEVTVEDGAMDSEERVAVCEAIEEFEPTEKATCDADNYKPCSYLSDDDTNCSIEADKDVEISVIGSLHNDAKAGDAEGDNDSVNSCVDNLEIEKPTMDIQQNKHIQAETIITEAEHYNPDNEKLNEQDLEEEAEETGDFNAEMEKPAIGRLNTVDYVEESLDLENAAIPEISHVKAEINIQESELTEVDATSNDAVQIKGFNMPLAVNKSEEKSSNYHRAKNEELDSVAQVQKLDISINLTLETDGESMEPDTILQAHADESAKDGDGALGQESENTDNEDNSEMDHLAGGGSFDKEEVFSTNSESESVENYSTVEDASIGESDSAEHLKIPEDVTLAGDDNLDAENDDKSAELEDGETKHLSEDLNETKNAATDAISNQFHANAKPSGFTSLIPKLPTKTTPKEIPQLAGKQSKEDRKIPGYAAPVFTSLPSANSEVFSHDLPDADDSFSIPSANSKVFQINLPDIDGANVPQENVQELLPTTDCGDHLLESKSGSDHENKKVESTALPPIDKENVRISDSVKAIDSSSVKSAKHDLGASVLNDSGSTTSDDEDDEYNDEEDTNTSAESIDTDAKHDFKGIFPKAGAIETVSRASESGKASSEHAGNLFERMTELVDKNTNVAGKHLPLFSTDDDDTIEMPMKQTSKASEEDSDIEAATNFDNASLNNTDVDKETDDVLGIENSASSDRVNKASHRDKSISAAKVEAVRSSVSESDSQQSQDYQTCSTDDSAFPTSVITADDYIFCESIAEKVKRKQRERARPLTYKDPFLMADNVFEPPRRTGKREISIFRSSILEKRAREKSLSPVKDVSLCSPKKKRNSSLPRELKDAFIGHSHELHVHDARVNGVTSNIPYIDRIKSCSVKLDKLKDETIKKYTHRRKRCYVEDETEFRPPIKVTIKLNQIVLPNSPYGSTSASDANRSGYESGEDSETEGEQSYNADSDVNKMDTKPDTPVYVAPEQAIDRAANREPSEGREPIRISMKSLLTKMSSFDKEALVHDSNTDEYSSAVEQSFSSPSKTLPSSSERSISETEASSKAQQRSPSTSPTPKRDVLFYLSDSDNESHNKSKGGEPKSDISNSINNSNNTFEESSGSSDSSSDSESDSENSDTDNVAKSDTDMDVQRKMENILTKPTETELSGDELDTSGGAQEEKREPEHVKPILHENPSKIMRLVKTDMDLSESDSDEERESDVDYKGEDQEQTTAAHNGNIITSSHKQQGQDSKQSTAADRYVKTGTDTRASRPQREVDGADRSKDTVSRPRDTDEDHGQIDDNSHTIVTDEAEQPSNENTSLVDESFNENDQRLGTNDSYGKVISDEVANNEYHELEADPPEPLEQQCKRTSDSAENIELITKSVGKNLQQINPDSIKGYTENKEHNNESVSQEQLSSDATEVETEGLSNEQEINDSSELQSEAQQPIEGCRDEEVVYYSVELTSDEDAVKDFVVDIDSVDIVDGPIVVHSHDTSLCETVETEVIPSHVDNGDLEENLMDPNEAETAVNNIKLTETGNTPECSGILQAPSLQEVVSTIHSKYLYGINDDSQSSMEVTEELVTDNIGNTDLDLSMEGIIEECVEYQADVEHTRTPNVLSETSVIPTSSELNCTSTFVETSVIPTSSEFNCTSTVASSGEMLSHEAAMITTDKEANEATTYYENNVMNESEFTRDCAQTGVEAMNVTAACDAEAFDQSYDIETNLDLLHSFPS